VKDKKTNAGYGKGMASGSGGGSGGGRGGGRTTRSTKISYPKNKTAKSVTRQLVKAENRAAKKDPRYTLDRMYEQGAMASPTRRMTAEARREARLREKGIRKAEIDAAKEYSPPGRYAGKRNPNTAKAKKVTKPKRQPAVYAISMKPKLPSQKVPARKLRSFIFDD